MEATISKKTFWIIIIALVFGLGLLVYALSKTTPKVKDVLIPQVVTPETPISISYEGLYGRYENEEDDLSYLEISEHGFLYYMNGCEGYFKYDNNSYDIDIDYKKDENQYKAVLVIKSRIENVSFEFNSDLSSTEEIISFIGPYSCSTSRNYIKKQL